MDTDRSRDETAGERRDDAPVTQVTKHDAASRRRLPRHDADRAPRGDDRRKPAPPPGPSHEGWSEAQR